jgi:O-antigen ligase
MRSVAGGCLVVSGTVLFMTGSRTAMLAALVAAPVLLLSGEERRLAVSGGARRVAACAYVVSVVAVLALMPAWAQHAAERGSAIEQQTFSGRTVLWDEAVSLIKARPLMGWGPFVAGVAGARETLLARVSQAHNAVIEAALVGGIPGLLLWLALVIGLWRALRLLRGPNRSLLLGLFVCVVVEGVGEGGPAWYGPAWLLLLSLVAVTTSPRSTAIDPAGVPVPAPERREARAQ